MLSKEDVRLGNCLECHKRINPKGKRVFIYKNEFIECWVHVGACLENYKKLLTGPEAIKQGMILGICDICLKPVRDKQRYVVSRIGKCTSKEEDSFLTTFPSSENKHFISFTHEECENSLH